jgi:hypothetical protein
MRHVGREMDVAPVLTPIDVRARPAVTLRTWTAFESILATITGDGTTVGKCKRFLKRHIDALPDSSETRMSNAGQSQHRRHGSGHLIGQMARRRALAFGIVALSEKKSARRIGDSVAAFVMTIRTGSSEGRQRNHDQV